MRAKQIVATHDVPLQTPATQQSVQGLGVRLTKQHVIITAKHIALPNCSLLSIVCTVQVCIPTHDSQRFYSTNDLCALGHGTSSSGGSGTAAAPSPSDGRYSSRS